VDEIGGLIVDAIRKAAQAKAAQQRSGQPGPPAGEVLRRILVGPGNPPPPTPAQAAQAARAATKAPPPPRPAPPAPAPPAPAPVQPLLADFSNPRRFLAAFVLAEALGPPVGLKGHGPG